MSTQPEFLLNDCDCFILEQMRLNRIIKLFPFLKQCYVYLGLDNNLLIVAQTADAAECLLLEVVALRWQSHIVFGSERLSLSVENAITYEGETLPFSSFSVLGDTLKDNPTP